MQVSPRFPRQPIIDDPDENAFIVAALLASIDQSIAEAEALAAQPATADMRQFREMILKGLRDTRRATEALLDR
jgi:hypothetical protein